MSCVTLTLSQIYIVIAYKYTTHSHHHFPTGDGVIYREGGGPVNIIAGNVTITDQNHLT